MRLYACVSLCAIGDAVSLYPTTLALAPTPRERKVSKKYLCICCGDPPPHFVVDTALERMEDHEVAMRVVPSGRETSQSKPSKTLFVTVAR